ncbi:hypothetical protein [Methylobacterium sp. J-068]|uniref:hypothetical protein n=1 Tax=Methylobacterium sp. J-068 TaxID=2836649 RepID=UPI001FB95715|nr:hypothetical protein [Methylobacterium sp. J-068]MCJ2037078.1 hypothetical protein [Methylobacterium sp. J-068]
MAIPVRRAAERAPNVSGADLSIGFTPVFAGRPLAEAISVNGSLTFVSGGGAVLVASGT